MLINDFSFSLQDLGDNVIFNMLHAVFVINKWRSMTGSKAARKGNGNLTEVLFMTWEVSSFLLKCSVKRITPN
jgi:hypothetical protein